jgi:hypothetical protein
MLELMEFWGVGIDREFWGVGIEKLTSIDYW